MNLRLLFAASLCVGSSCLVSAAAWVETEGLPTIWGIPFEEIDARWEGGFRDGVLITDGRLPGSAGWARYEHRVVRGESGWETRARLEFPLSYLEDVGVLLRAFPGMGNVVGSGGVGLSMTMTSRGGQTRWEGKLELVDVFLEEPELELVVAGLTGSLDWSHAEGSFLSKPRQLITFESLVWDEVEAENGVIEFGMISPREWQLDRAVLDWAGGQLSAGEFSFDPTLPDVRIRLRADGIQLGELLRMVPDFEGEGEGVIDGELSVRIRSAGIGLEPGHLGLRPGAPARLRLPSRAWFTAEMSPEQPSYKNLRMVERALEDLELRRFRLDFLSEQAPDIPLQLTIEGRPMADDVPAPSVGMTLNVHGPIRQLGSWMLSPGVRIDLQ